MHLLFLGPPCERIESHLLSSGHSILRTEESFDTKFLEEKKFQFGISYRYKKIIPPPEISWFSGKLINLHISLLPWNRGADPNLWSFLEKSPIGVSIHLIDQGIDTGDVLLQKKVSINLETSSLRSSWEYLAKAIELLFIENSFAILQGQICSAPQAEGGSFHLSTDKKQYEYLWQKKGWDTPVKELLGKAKKT